MDDRNVKFEKIKVNLHRTDWLKNGGLLLIAAALLLSAVNLLSSNQAAHSVCQSTQSIKSSLNQTAATSVSTPSEPLPAAEAEIPDYQLNPNMPMPTQEVGNIAYIGLLSIDELDLELAVAENCSNAQLKHTPCCYFGSAYTDDLVIAGHNYAAHFGRLKNLSLGSSLCLCDMDGNEFYYTVSEVQVLPDTAIDEMCSGEYPLTLFTCTLGGQSRLAIRCSKID